MSEVKDIKPYYLWNFHKDYGLIGYYDTKEEAIAEARLGKRAQRANVILHCISTINMRNDMC